MKTAFSNTSERRRAFPVRLVVGCSIAVLLAGCASTSPSLRDEVVRATAEPSTYVSPETWAQQAQRDAEVNLAEETARREPTLIPGNDRMVNLPAAKTVRVAAGGAISLRFEQAPITDFVHAILGDLLKVGYTIHQPVGGEVTIHTQAPVPPKEVMSILESVLSANGLGLARDAQGLYHVGRPDALRGLGTAPVNVRALAAGQSMVVVPLQYIGAGEMAEILAPIVTPEALVRVDGVRNLLILAGSASQIESWLDFVNIFDVDMLKGMSVGLFPLQYASVKEIDIALRAVTGAAPMPSAGASAESGGQQEAPAAMRQLPAFGPLGSVVRVLPIERLNALLVVTPRAHYLQQAKEWIEKLDRPTDGGTEPQLYVYPVQNGSAQHLGSLLSAVFGGGSQTGARSQTDSGVAPGLSSSGLGGFGGGSTNMISQALGSGSREGGQTPTLTQFSLGKQIRVVADEYNNALLIYAPGSEYRKIEAALRRLDLSPTQVLIEASILEVTLNDETRFGLQWFFEGGLGDGYRGSGLLTDRNSQALGRTVPGFSYSITNAAGQVRAVLNALATKSLVNVISSPSVMVLDNHTATIHVGDQQPIRSATQTTDGGVTTSSIQYKDTGVMLQVTPSANSGGMVSMLIKQSVTDVGTVDDATGQRSFNQRQMASKVAVRTGETVILGGLIRDSDNNGKQGIPWLVDVPVLGHLFGTTTTGTKRTELLVMITPRVVQSDQQVRDLGSEMRRRMSSLQVLPGWERFEPGHGVDRPDSVDPHPEVEVHPIQPDPYSS